MYNVLIIDDDEIFLQSLKNLLVYQNFNVDLCSNPNIAISKIQKNNYHLILLDVAMPGLSGMELLSKIRHVNFHLPIIMVSGQSTISTAVEAIKKGAFDFIEKPVDPEKLQITLNNALKQHVLELERFRLIEELKNQFQIIGISQALDNILSKINKIAMTDAKVLITGETGTGKELVARAIHLRSPRSTGPFVKINCAAIPSDLLESELFGHKKGAFTGANQDQIGKFQAADGGTLFLDEIGDMDLRLQAKLLHVLQDNTFNMLGSSVDKQVDIRIIAATNKDLKQLIKEGKFRMDLYHRLNVVNIHIPPLRNRPEDIEVLTRHFINEFSETYNKPIRDISTAALQVLKQKSWPGNVRELKNFIEKTIIFANGPIIEPHDLPDSKQKTEASSPVFPEITLKEALEAYERKLILQALKQTGGRISETAKLLGITRSALFKKKKKLGIL